MTDKQGRTLLYFASDRSGGRGGMDLYVSVQQDPADPLSFAPPINLGTVVNTVSDEVTPFYDPEGGHLYFASSGHPGFGGLDVFRAPGQFNTFSPPENLGRPVNSAAEDYGLSLAVGSGRGYLVSNRKYGDEKLLTTEADIYALNFRGGRARLKAAVYDNTTGSELSGAEVILFTVDATGGRQEIARRTFSTGQYDFELQPGRSYEVTVRRTGYQSVTYRVETSLSGSNLYGQPVFLLRQSGAPPPVPAPETPAPTASPQTSPSSTPAPPPASGPSDPAPASAPATTYRIQISAVKDFTPADPKYDAVRSLGELRSEAIPGKKIRRITVGYYTSPSAAKAALERVKAAGFPKAFAVRYDAGRRIGIERF